MRSARIWYKKTGTAKFISHLDMNRCMTRAVRRAQIPLWYTEGFNPHPYMTFLMPLALGQEALREPIDIKIEQDDITYEEIKARLNSVMPQGIEIVDVCEPVKKANDIAAAEYRVSVTFGTQGEAQGFASGSEAVIESGTLNAEKRSKKGMKTVNLCEMVRSFECESRNNVVFIKTVLAAGSSINLNADLLMNALFKEFSAEYKQNNIVRTELLCDDLSKFE